MKIRNRKLIRALAHALAWALRGLFRFVRLHLRSELKGIDPYDDAGDQRFLYSLWHDAIIGILFCRPHQRMAGLVSLHADGAWVADAMEIFGVRPIRGSSGRRGAGAVREMLDAARELHITITTDGPRGPRRQVKDGIIYLASHSGRAIVPAAFVADRAWRPRGSWTDMLIPKPWSHAWMVGIRPIHVPPGLRPDELEPYRRLLQLEMDALHAFCEKLVRREVTDFYPGWRTDLGFPERVDAIETARAA
jgi:lysophospholipid acyltransferase (LPLAT)-like uncharacterized protein